MQPAKRSATAYWDFYDASSGKILEKEHAVYKAAMPAQGMLVTNITGKPNAVIRTFKFSRIVNGLPCYDVYV
jgi:hypothetical protein